MVQNTLYCSILLKATARGSVLASTKMLVFYQHDVTGDLALFGHEKDSCGQTTGTPPSTFHFTRYKTFRTVSVTAYLNLHWGLFHVRSYSSAGVKKGYVYVRQRVEPRSPTYRCTILGHQRCVATGAPV